MSQSMIAYDHPHLKSETKPADRSVSNTADALDDTAIADLSPLHISRMTRGELVRVIKAARLPLLTSSEHLEFRDRETLERLVHLARRCCHNRTAASQSRGRDQEKPYDE